MMFSYSRVDCFAQCPMRYKFRYVDGLKTLPDQDPSNALYLGVALHLGLETGSVEEAIENYKSNYYIITDAHINEIIKLEYVIPKALQILPPGECEIEISTSDFIGYIDRLCPTYVDDKGIQHWDLYDYKYTTNGDRYKNAKQLHIYKYYYELTHPGNVIDNLNYLIIKKVNIRQKKTETIQQFRQRLREVLEATEPIVTDISYNKDIITDFHHCCQHLKFVNEFPKNETRLCDWCSYKEFCKSDGLVDYMIIKE